MTLIYHITSSDAWHAAQAAGVYRVDSLDSEGFIHTSLAGQVGATASRYYQGRKDLILLVIDENRVKSEVRYELAAIGEVFPHIYGPLNLDAVVRVLDFNPDNPELFA
ncbi:MAG: DUF952 domain-containing protein [Anaerolineaceae bacterium]|nr:DUF952 domain-containing protein [Anaerolineaceae bacterium]